MILCNPTHKQSSCYAFLTSAQGEKKLICACHLSLQMCRGESVLRALSTPFLISLYPSFTLRTISDISCSDELKRPVFAPSLGSHCGQTATPRVSLTLQNLFHSSCFSFRCLRLSQEAVRQRKGSFRQHLK